MCKLSNLKGRINYISSSKRQENLYAVYKTTDNKFWNELAKCNQKDFYKSGTAGKCIEARELIIALPESFVKYDPDELLKALTDKFITEYDVHCISALHHNKRKTNYHIHMIFAERRLLKEPVRKIATRNMFYNEHGKHVRTKKEILDENNEIKSGCKIIKKGEVYEEQIFTPKDELFKQEHFLDEVKRMYTDYINLYVNDAKEKLTVFDKNGPYLATKKIGKNNPKSDEIKQDNEIRLKWNQEVDLALVSGVPEADILKIKKERITGRIKNTIAVFGKAPEKFAHIVTMAIGTLALLVSEVLKAARTVVNIAVGKDIKVPSQAPENIVINENVNSNSIAKEVATEGEPEHKAEVQKESKPVAIIDTEDAKVKVPSETEVLIEQHEFLEAVGQVLSDKNGAIFNLEKKRNELEIELEDCKGIFMKKCRTELEDKISNINKQIETHKAEFSKIVIDNGFQNVSEFYKRLYASRDAWEKNENIGKKSVMEQLAKYDREKENQVNVTSVRKGQQRGAR